MPDPLHHTTLAAITRLAQTHGLPIVRADTEKVIVGDYVIVPEAATRIWCAYKVCRRGYDLLGVGTSPLNALRAALREVKDGDAV